MGVAVGIRVTDGVAIVADRRVLDGDTVRTDDQPQLLSWDDGAVAGVGHAHAIQALHRSLREARREYQWDRGNELGLDALSHIAAKAAEETETACLLTARDEDGRATLRELDSSGGLTTSERAAIGKGNELALGAIETVEQSISVEAAAQQLEAVLAQLADRHAGIGPNTDQAILVDEQQP